MPVPTLAGERVTLRTWRAEDAEAVLRIYGDPEVTAFLNRTLTTLDEARAGIARSLAAAEATGDRLGSWAIVADDAVVGCGLLKQLEDGPEIEVGYHLARDAWGNGHATEAARVLLAYGFEVLHLERIVAVVDPGNAASLAVIERLGMTRDGEGVYCDTLCWHFGMTPDEHARLRG